MIWSIVNLVCLILFSSITYHTVQYIRASPFVILQTDKKSEKFSDYEFVHKILSKFFFVSYDILEKL
ncbi:MAG TPA: hypothetical protein ENG63_01305 [Candidatus Desulfofervidus auxilii]|uniref:Uncharacterized protein n=1 Tax=Desulfofervidus auxilii TaxID=1621989 RepID=A0A7C0Y496_DESA2|nr:hypothetical protein [Candidatus Desulfofervidus auxilii]